MKKHSLLLSISSILSTAVLLHALFSCSGKQATEEEVSEAEASEVISEEGSTGEETISDNTEQKKENLSELESTVGDKAEADEESLSSDDETKNEESLVSDESAEKSESLDSLEGNNNVAANTPPAETTAEIIPEPAGEVPSLPAEVPVAKPAKKHTPRRSKQLVSTVPRIPGKALEKADGTKLNRFYFLRKGDNPKKVSELLYGKANHAKDLQKWNAGPFTPGKLIFYSSPIAADDTRMQSFYQERSIPFEPYTVGEKETIFSVAAKKLGDTRSWKEIAVLNGLEDAKQVQAGSKLEIQPMDLKSAASPLEKPKVAEQPKPEPVVAQATPAPDPNIGVPPPVTHTPPAPVAAEAPKEEGSGGIGDIVSQNLLPIVVGGALIVFLILLAAVSKRGKKKSMADDFGDEGFSAPPKLKKRK